MADRIGDRVGGAGGRRAAQAAARPGSGGRHPGARRHRARRARCCPRCPALRLEIDEHAHHKDVYEHSLIALDRAIELEQARGHEPDLVLRLAVLLHDIGKPATRKIEPGGAGQLPPPRRARREAGGEAAARAALRQRHREGGRRADPPAPAVLRLRRRHLDRLGGAPLRARRRAVCSSGSTSCRARTSRPATSARPTPSRRPTTTWRSGSPRWPRRRSSPPSAPTSTASRSWRILDLKPGPEVGEAYRFLLELRLDEGPLRYDIARDRLLAWWPARD